ncbi:hypothetical protein L249_3607, partial [Ophiocordyceps polyrhachis-furcata BCC 54312]
ELPAAPVPSVLRDPGRTYYLPSKTCAQQDKRRFARKYAVAKRETKRKEDKTAAMAASPLCLSTSPVAVALAYAGSGRVCVRIRPEKAHASVASSSPPLWMSRQTRSGSVPARV